MTVKNVVFWNVTPCSLNLPTLRGASCLLSILKIEAIYSLITSVLTKTPHNPEVSVQPHSRCALSAQNVGGSLPTTAILVGKNNHKLWR